MNASRLAKLLLIAPEGSAIDLADPDIQWLIEKVLVDEYEPGKYGLTYSGSSAVDLAIKATHKAYRE